MTAIRGPYRLETKGLTPSERVRWWNRHGGSVTLKIEALSFFWKKALRQDWRLD